VHDMDLVDPAVGRRQHERGDQRVGDFFCVGVGGLLREAGPALLDGPPAELVEADRLAADQEADRLLPLRTQGLFQRGGLLDGVGVVAAGQAAVAAHDQDGRPRRIRVLRHQRMVDR